MPDGSTAPPPPALPRPSPERALELTKKKSHSGSQKLGAALEVAHFKRSLMNINDAVGAEAPSAAVPESPDPGFSPAVVRREANLGHIRGDHAVTAHERHQATLAEPLERCFLLYG